MKVVLTEKMLQDVQKSLWDFSNQILYDLCRENFKHEKDGPILAKVLLIGRTYAAAVERRNTRDDLINDDFYFKKIVPTFKKSKLDQKLRTLKGYNSISTENIADILKIHYYLIELLRKDTSMEKRSFSSKYLHFHLPDLFFIYDSRAESALRKYTSRIPKDLKQFTQLESVDEQYAKFFCKCLDVKRQIEEEHNMQLTIRQFDNLLINMANKLEVEKRKASTKNL
ncbi:hypothetical protein C5O00_06960 [Pukyongia salina]|uniref:Uncharacterized protein n=1 Tax=Pukyongia salina TaxID=2094025 RepID=A0A2S0HWC7_9FLAO|nr:hypothetical protein [Pukyongia salina]AVI50928.1 hypothetical protein C5O00_06960 [Pukyongia salina]